MGYSVKSYGIPGSSMDYMFIGPATQYTSWQSCGPIPSVPHDGFAIPVNFTLNMSWTKVSFWWTAVPTIQLATSAGTVLYEFQCGYLNSHASGWGNGIIEYDTGGAWTGTIERCRLALACSSNVGWPYTCSVSCSISSGGIDVYEPVTGTIAADVQGGTTPAGPAIVSAGKAGQIMTRFRYRMTQTAQGDINWSGSPVGTDLRRFS